MVLNERQRVEEELLRNGKVVGGVRMQVHWLMSLVLAQRGRGGGNGGSVGSASTGGGGGVGSPSGGGSGSASASTAQREARSGLRLGRRLSDSNRGDTKL